MTSPVERLSWFAGIIGAIFAAYAFFAGDSESPNKATFEKIPATIVQHAGNNSTQVGNNSGTVIITSPSEARVIDEPVDILGKWNQAAALDIARNHLRQASFPQENFDVPPYMHELVGEYNMLYKGGQALVLVMKTKPHNFDCHACAPFLSFLEFEKRLRGWKLLHIDIAAIQYGSWGEFSESNLSVRVIGSNQYGAFIEGGYTAQGHTNSATDLYTRIGDKFREVLSIATAEETSIIQGEGESWNSTIAIIPTDTGFYDLVVERKGDLRWHDIPDAFIEDLGSKNGKIRPKDIFRFDGTRYRRSELFK